MKRRLVAAVLTVLLFSTFAFFAYQLIGDNPRATQDADMVISPRDDLAPGSQLPPRAPGGPTAEEFRSGDGAYAPAQPDSSGSAPIPDLSDPPPNTRSRVKVSEDFRSATFGVGFEPIGWIDYVGRPALIVEVSDVESLTSADGMSTTPTPGTYLFEVSPSAKDEIRTMVSHSGVIEVRAQNGMGVFRLSSAGPDIGGP